MNKIKSSLLKNTTDQGFINLGYGSTPDDHMLSDTYPDVETRALTRDEYLNLYERNQDGFYVKKEGAHDRDWETLISCVF